MLQPMSLQRVGHDLATEQSQQHLRVSHQGKAGSKNPESGHLEAWGLSRSKNYLCLELFLLSFLFCLLSPTLF